MPVGKGMALECESWWRVKLWWGNRTGPPWGWGMARARGARRARRRVVVW